MKVYRHERSLGVLLHDRGSGIQTRAVSSNLGAHRSSSSPSKAQSNYPHVSFGKLFRGTPWHCEHTTAQAVNQIELNFQIVTSRTPDNSEVRGRVCWSAARMIK